MKLQERLKGHASRWGGYMADKLLENVNKGESWGDDDPASLLKRVREETDELAHAISNGAPHSDVRREAADVANMAMMVADAYGGTRKPDA